MKPWRTFGVLEQLSVDDFDLVKLEEDVDAWKKGQWTLQLGGVIVFSLPFGVVGSIGPYSEKGHAETLFQHFLNMRTAFGQIAYERGQDSVRKEIQEILGAK